MAGTSKRSACCARGLGKGNSAVGVRRVMGIWARERTSGKGRKWRVLHHHVLWWRRSAEVHVVLRRALGILQVRFWRRVMGTVLRSVLWMVYRRCLLGMRRLRLRCSASCRAFRLPGTLLRRGFFARIGCWGNSGLRFLLALLCLAFGPPHGHGLTALLGFYARFPSRA